MQPIETEFEDRLFRYRQVARQGDVAIYTQEHKASRVQRFEVVHIRTQREHTWPDGTVTPEKEAYPASASWGRRGWTFSTLAGAQAKVAALQAHVIANDALEPPPG